MDKKRCECGQKEQYKFFFEKKKKKEKVCEFISKN